ncbi:putative reverse transcriptase domain, reverse transcriptase zinc-binding domain protein, partial [Tanacetum coccineum]
MACVKSPSFSICVNGDIHGFFKGKRGLRQGDPLSPYLFTLVMEVLTLILQRRVRLSDSFRYHKQCGELRIINVCFADDLFLFSRGDVASATVIMDSLNEFKQVSGLVPSIPKSTVFFCNVVNHVKLSILNVMPFSEGVLPVNYLGVPLISSRLLNKDCKVLVEKVRNRIRDWKNKSLSFAGRLQLCNSVISSMQVYWALVLAIPFGIIDDIQRLIRGFLWCNGEYKRGKAKVSWEDICLPKREGGLGIRCLEVFNIALMTTHIWNIVSNKESLWVRWIHMYKLKGRTLWDIQPKASMSWGWRKLLQLRDIVKPFLWKQVGNGLRTSLWYDTWCDQSPLANFLTPRDITRNIFHLRMCVADIITNGAWDWPQAWLLKAPNLGLILVPVLNDTEDCIRWRDGN